MRRRVHRRRFEACAILLLFGAVLSGCDHGLTPVQIQPGFGGTIRFTGTWLPQSDTTDLRLVASKVFRKFASPTEVIALVLTTDSVKIYPPVAQSRGLQMGQAELRYQFFVDPGEYKFVALLYRYGSQIFSDWRVIGFYGSYTATELSPRSVVVRPGEFTEGIDFAVDLNNPPPQPF
ncbi:MAG: hypothetical protein COS95_04390 [Ignavibacteriales bacterium CG07_land_8_20_14_0_80_59_12]|nr:MAG: hypothetical protein COS95_04390 [Ignavibacteriales bacterium CG07_land_8_20_14_0_80_59_12]